VIGTTDSAGRYSLGPFPRDLAYTVKAEKLGYILTETETKGSYPISPVILTGFMDPYPQKLKTFGRSDP
jgi:hypothetical protein